MLNTYSKLFKKKYSEKIKMWIRVGGWCQPMWIINKFYNIIIKSANVNKGVFFFNPSLKYIGIRYNWATAV